MYNKNYNYNKKVSILGFGCMRLPKIEGTEEIDEQETFKIFDYAYENGVNYFDTAWPYHSGKSEVVVGKALKRFDREKINITTKMPGWLVKEPNDAKVFFEKQLENLQTDYFDFYLCHALNDNSFKNYEENGILNFLIKMKEEGKIKNLGFSYHGSIGFLRELVKKYDWDFAQLQINYLDWELIDAKTQYEILAENNIPCVVMEPVKGGMLASLSPQSAKILKDCKPNDSVASWAIRYVAGLENVFCLLSGMSNMEQTVDNIKTLSQQNDLNDSEKKVLNDAINEFKRNKTISCTNCRYCMDCPNGVDIPKMFKLYNDYSLNGSLQKYKDTLASLPTSELPSNCIKCGKCMEQCPQKINIIKELEKLTQYESEK